MAAFIIRRLLQSGLVLAIMSVLVFSGVYLIGDPVELLIAPDATQSERDQFRTALGLDQSLPQQYLRFLRGVFSGDLGTSFVYNEPAVDVIFHRLPATLELAIVALGLTILVGIPLGMLAGLRPNSRLAKGIMAGSILGFSLPTFWIGLVLIMVFAVWLGWLPSTGRGEAGQLLGLSSSLFSLDGWAHLLLPALNLALFNIALVIRLTRAGVREAALADYVKFARAKGLAPLRVVLVHILKNIMIPIVTVLGLEFGSLIAFAVVTESIFAWPGMGKLIIDSIYHLDRPVIVAYLMLTVGLVIMINLAVDLIYTGLDPRVRLREMGR